MKEAATKKTAMSTGWNSSRHDAATGILDELAGLGMASVEAGYKMRPGQLAGLADLAAAGRCTVESVHNFCPTPDDHRCGWGDDFLLSSPDEEERRRGVRAVFGTMEWAERLRAKVIVMHLGLVAVDRQPYETIKRLIREGRPHCPEHRAAVKELREERERRAAPFFAAARRTLDDLLPRLPPGVRLGIESRYEYFALPNLGEMEKLLREYAGAIGYWHDIGHAFVQETMGFYPRGAYIETLHGGMIGAHIHDCLGISDHLAPGEGEIDFKTLLAPYLSDDTLRVLEFHPRVSPEEASRGIRRLREMGII